MKKFFITVVSICFFASVLYIFYILCIKPSSINKNSTSITSRENTEVKVSSLK